MTGALLSLLLAARVATPTFSPAAGTYTSTQSVTVKSKTPGARIYCSQAGAPQRVDAQRYTGAISVAATATLSCRAFRDGYDRSLVASGLYTITPPASTPTFLPVAGSYSTTQTVAISSTSPGVQIYYTTDGTTPTTGSTLYTGPVTVAASMTIQAIATGGSYSSSPVGSAAYTINTSTVYALAADRLTTWRPGVTYNGGIPNRTTICTTLSPSGGNDTTAIQTAITNCPSGQVVYLNAGTFNVSGTYTPNVKSGVTLRGAGAGVTTILKTDGATAAKGNDCSPAPAPAIRASPTTCYNYPYCDFWTQSQSGAVSYNLNADGTHGATSVVLSGAASGSFAAGQFVLLDESANAAYRAQPGGTWSSTTGIGPDGHGTNIYQSDDGLLTWACWDPESNPGGIQEDCRTNAYSRDGRITSEVKEVASWAFNSPSAGLGTLTFTSPIHAQYRVNHSAQVMKMGASESMTGAGIENLTVKGGCFANITFSHCMHCWAKNVESTQFLGEGVKFEVSFQSELRDSYVHTPVYFEPGGGSYNLALDTASSEILIENSISRDADKVIVARGAGAGSVVAYNYMDDGHIGSVPGWQEMGVGASHFVGPHHVLFEGNWGYNADNDKTHGNSWGHTYFRNHLTGKRTSYDAQCVGRAAGFTRSAKKMSFVGNVLGLSGQTGGLVYEATQWGTNGIWLVGWDDWNPYRWDGAALADTIRDGNFDYLTNQVHWHGLGGSGQANGLTPPAASTLPDSLYLTAKPSFFGANTWPWVDATGATKTYTLPAKARYDAGTPNVVP